MSQVRVDRILAAVLLVVSIVAATVSATDVEFFEAKIRPVLVEHCYACHNSVDTAEGELALDFRDGLRRGGSGGELVVPGHAEQSRLIAILKHQVEGLEMPVDGPQLDEQVIADFEKWITEGAIDPRDEPASASDIRSAAAWPATLERRKRWWSFQPIRAPQPPAGDGHPIDRFLGTKLSDAGLTPAPRATPEILIRRLYFALLGLPPSPAELRHWSDRWQESEVRDELIDHLLASDQFGVRWARHWMDWFRYAESHGSEGDPEIQDAWLYRDYLIRALNRDVPYDQLVREHLAGDLLSEPRINQALELNESILGTIQLRMVFHGFSPTDALDEKVRFIDDQVNTLTKALLGLTVSCARCHDHKFDAVSQADYYAMFGIFAACRPARKVIDLPSRLERNLDTLAEMKPRIRRALVDDWSTKLPRLPHQLNEMMAGDVAKDSLLELLQQWSSLADEGELGERWRQWSATQNQPDSALEEAAQRWDFSAPPDHAQWYREGTGSVQQVSTAGEFAVAANGDQALIGVYPAGVYSHGLSSKHPARLTSPDFELDDKYEYWVHAIGSDGARTRYVVHDYPRTGTVYPALDLNPSWTWHRLNLDYWQGDSVHFEVASGKDIPLLAADRPRSWFGIREVRVVPHGLAPPTVASPFRAAIRVDGDQAPESVNEALTFVSNAISEAVQAWQASKCSDAQAELIDHCLRLGVLENRLEQLPQARLLIEQYRVAEGQIPVPRRVPGVEDVPGRTQPLYVRGNHKQPAERVPRRFLSAIDSQPYPGDESGRLQLAQDVLRDDNPLARRVIVNRLWHHLFGSGIVATPDNFGRLGAQPTHPELLDYLATRFVEDGWSLKSMIRLIVTSQAWQQVSDPSPEAQQRDPDNQWLSHANLRRLEAEAIRDAMLAASQRLELVTAGPPVDATQGRRSIFLRVQRNALEPMLRAFDFPEPFSAVGRRDVTNVPAQSLLLMNSSRVAEYAAGIAQQVIAEGTGESARINSLYARLFARQPSSSELEILTRYLAQSRQELARRRTAGDQLRAEIQELQNQIDSIVETSRPDRPTAATETLTSGSRAGRPQPIAHWEFGSAWTDQVGSLDAAPQGGAKRDREGLVVAGGGYAVTAPLQQSLTAKTLEAWVRLDTLDQRGGGVMSLQTTDGNVFDAIVFGEQQPRRWLAGSDHHARTQPFADAEPEADAVSAAVQLAIAYHGDGTVVGYRNGRRYGQPYQTGLPVKFESGQSLISFGLRHLPPRPDRGLAGVIVRARLYDQALSDEQLQYAYQHGSAELEAAQRLASLDPPSQGAVAAAQKQIDALSGRLESIGDLPPSEHELAIWTDAAKSLLMAKEFVYVR